MSLQRNLSTISAVVLAATFFASSACAQQGDVRLTAEAGVRATDNIRRTADTLVNPASDQLIYLAGFEFSVLRQTSRLFIDAVGSVSRRSYESGTFSDETLARLNATLSLKLIEEFLDWDLQADHGQQVVDPFQPVTPENREDITIVSTGPRFNIALGNRTSVQARATVTDMAYEVRPLDNQRFGAEFGLVRNVTADRAISLNVSGSRLEYDDSLLSPPIETYQVYFGIDSNDSRNDLVLRIGWNQFEQSGLEGDGLLLDLNWGRQITPQARLILSAGSRFSTNGDVFTRIQELNAQSPPVEILPPDAEDIQGADDPFQSDFVAVNYILTKARTTFLARANWSEEDYELSNTLDRTLLGAGFSVRRELNPRLSVSVFAIYSERDFSNVARIDDDTIYGLELSQEIGQRLTVDLSISGFERRSDLLDDSFNELRGSLMFRYSVLGET